MRVYPIEIHSLHNAPEHRAWQGAGKFERSGLAIYFGIRESESQNRNAWVLAV